jgi:hypothetical protein
VDLRASLDDLEKRKFLTLPGLELRSPGRPARSYTDYAIPAPLRRIVRLINNKSGGSSRGPVEVLSCYLSGKTEKKKNEPLQSG